MKINQKNKPNYSDFRIQLRNYSGTVRTRINHVWLNFWISVLNQTLWQ